MITGQLTNFFCQGKTNSWQTFFAKAKQTVFSHSALGLFIKSRQINCINRPDIWYSRNGTNLTKYRRLVKKLQILGWKEGNKHWYRLKEGQIWQSRGFSQETILRNHFVWCTLCSHLWFGQGNAKIMRRRKFCVRKLMTYTVYSAQCWPDGDPFIAQPSWNGIWTSFEVCGIVNRRSGAKETQKL